jgi:hypothetical protein
LIKIAKQLGEGYIIVIHGRLLEDIKCALPKNIMVCDLILAEDELMEFIAMADIGLALYEGLSDNERLTAFSSHKLAIYSRCGIPYIAYANESFELLESGVVWGVSIFNYSDILEGINKILDDYCQFQLAAHRAYISTYNVNKYLMNIKQYLSRVN